MLSDIQALRQIREAIKDHYRVSRTARPKPSFRHISTAWDLALDYLYAEYETEVDIQEIVQKSLQIILCEDQEAGIVASQDEPSPQPAIKKQKTFVTAIMPLYTELNDCVRDYWIFKDQDPDFLPVFVDAKTILSDFESIISANERGEVVDISESEDSWFFQVAVDYIRDDLNIKRERLQAKKEALRLAAWNRKGKNKNNLAPGENPPGRPVSEIDRAMRILLSKIPHPALYTYTQKHLRQDLITHKASIKDIIKPFKKSDGYIYFQKAGAKEVSVQWALTKLKDLVSFFRTIPPPDLLIFQEHSSTPFSRAFPHFG